MKGQLAAPQPAMPARGVVRRMWLATAVFFLLPSGRMPSPAVAGLAAWAPAGLCSAAVARAEAAHPLPDGLLAAIARTESGRTDPETGARAPWPWTVNAEGHGRYYPTRADAVAAVLTLQAQGVQSIDVGCMQVNLMHHPAAFASVDDAFDPQLNADYAARFLASLHDRSAGWMGAAMAYHSRTPGLAEAYGARVAAAWTALPGIGMEDSPGPAAASRWAPVVFAPGTAFIVPLPVAFRASIPAARVRAVRTRMPGLGDRGSRIRG